MSVTPPLSPSSASKQFVSPADLMKHRRHIQACVASLNAVLPTSPNPDPLIQQLLSWKANVEIDLKARISDDTLFEAHTDTLKNIIRQHAASPAATFTMLISQLSQTTPQTSPPVQLPPSRRRRPATTLDAQLAKLKQEEARLQALVTQEIAATQLSGQSLAQTLQDSQADFAQQEAQFQQLIAQGEAQMQAYEQQALQDVTTLLTSISTLSGTITALATATEQTAQTADKLHAEFEELDARLIKLKKTVDYIRTHPPKRRPWWQDALAVLSPLMTAVTFAYFGPAGMAASGGPGGFVVKTKFFV